MTDQLQMTLYRETWAEKFEAWVHTPKGREVADKFIKIAWGLHLRGKRVGAKMIVERIRWNLALKNDDGGDDYKVNNNYVSYLARFAMDREPRLAGFFNTREVGKEKKNRRVFAVEVCK